MAYKPVLSRLLVLILFVPAFTPGCGGGGGGGGNNPPPSPTVTTTAATLIGTDNAMLHGTVNPNAQATSAWLEWGTDNTLSSFTPTASRAVGAGTTDQTVDATITGLAGGEKYFFRAAATNASGTRKGAIAGFTTALPNSPPTVTSLAATSETDTGAVLNGNVIPNELATTAFFEWATDPGLSTPNATPAQSLGFGKTSVAINEPLSGLITGTTYYYRVAATNSAGSSRGTIVSFNTVARPPTVTTAVATSITGNSAVLNGTVNPNGLATDGYFKYGTSPTLDSFSATTVQSMGSGRTGASIAATVPLSPGTTYYFRTVATNPAGTSEGTIQSFSTVALPPTATTEAATSITPTGATFNGTVNPNGLATDARFEWGMSPTLASSATTGSQPLGSGSTGLPIEASLTGLTEGTTYYYRVVAANPGGTSNGTILDFTTPVPGTFTYNSSGHNARVAAGDGVTVIFSKLLPPVTDYSGVFSLDFSPTSDYGDGGNVSIRLNDTPTTYFQLSTKDALVTKVRKGVVVDSAAFPFPYSQGGTYSIRIAFSQAITTFEAFGGSVSLTTDDAANPIVYFEVETTQQDAFYDNIKLETGAPLSTAYFDDFSADTIGSYLVFTNP
ncbi:MAG: hypothetical protein FIA93_01290 [Deltaproteobacteria bacterium]|nr:hypothetical protein [Deltaproteobacteria bacterium]